jgi:hypothetical protein
MMYSKHAEDPLYHPVVIKDERRFWKTILIVDDDEDVTKLMAQLEHLVNRVRVSDGQKGWCEYFFSIFTSIAEYF